VVARGLADSKEEQVAFYSAQPFEAAKPIHAVIESMNPFLDSYHGSSVIKKTAPFTHK